MGPKTDSVRVNLSDLFEMEAQRRADEAAAKERAKAEAQARDARERAEREAAIAAARDEERRRAEVELEANRVGVEARIAALRTELEAVRAAREETRAQVLEMGSRPAPRASRGSWLAGAMAAMSLVAALTATFVAWPRADVAVELPAPAPIAVVETPAEPTELVEPAPSEVVVPAPVEAPVVARPSRPTRPRPRPTQQTDLASQLDFSGTGDGLIPE